MLGVDGKVIISEPLCTGCGICVKKCPFDAITIVNLAEELSEQKVHQYGNNTFRLYRLPTPRNGSVVGLLGRNGVGKTTALNILSGNLKPNLGNYEEEPNWDDVLEFFKGTEPFGGLPLAKQYCRAMTSCFRPFKSLQKCFDCR